MLMTVKCQGTKDYSIGEGPVVSVLSDFQQLNIGRPYRDAQDKPAWRDRTCATHT